MLLELGRTTEATQDLKAALALDPQNTSTIASYASLLATSSPDEAIKLSSEGLALDGRNGKLWLQRGLAYENKGEAARALADLSVACRLLPDNANAWHHRALALKAEGQLDAAIVDFRKAFELSSDPSVGAQLKLALASLNKQRQPQTPSGNATNALVAANTQHPSVMPEDIAPTVDSSLAVPPPGGFIEFGAAEPEPAKPAIAQSEQAVATTVDSSLAVPPPGGFIEFGAAAPEPVQPEQIAAAEPLMVAAEPPATLPIEGDSPFAEFLIEGADNTAGPTFEEPAVAMLDAATLSLIHI